MAALEATALARTRTVPKIDHGALELLCVMRIVEGLIEIGFWRPHTNLKVVPHLKPLTSALSILVTLRRNFGHRLDRFAKAADRLTHPCVIDSAGPLPKLAQRVTSPPSAQPQPSLTPCQGLY